MRGAYRGKDGLMVNLDSKVSELFGYSQNQARKLIDAGEVRIDGEVTERVAIAVEDVAGRELSVRGEIHEVEA